MNETWTTYIWECDSFGDPEEAVDYYGMVPGDVLSLDLVECKVVAHQRWKIEEDGSLTELSDD